MEKFTKVKNIGKGNMGACALARNNEDGRYYVIKQVDLAKLNKKERQQSLNEAKVLSSLRHPNVINYFDSFLARKSDHLCIVMEFADGGDLSNRIKNNHGINFSETQVLDWLIQIVLSLHYVHQRKILHRDVKTQNIFLTQENICKLGDFGIARTLNSTYDQANTFVGTPYYLSPELILERPYDHMSDVWALGVVLYELLALRHPFNANDMKSLMHRILKVQYEPPPTMYSSELRSIVSRILVKDPLQRIRLGEILELPIVVKRVRQWIDGGILPSRYLGSLIRSKLLPPHLLAYAIQTSAGGGSGGSPTHYLQQQLPTGGSGGGEASQPPQALPTISRSPDTKSNAIGYNNVPYVPQAAPSNVPRPQPVKKEYSEYEGQPPSGVARYGGISPAPSGPNVDFRRPQPTDNAPEYQVYRPRADLPPTNVLRPAAALPPLNSAVGVAAVNGGGGVYRAYQAQQEYNAPPRSLAPVAMYGGGGPPPLRPANVGGGGIQVQNPYTSGAGVAAAIYGNQQRSAAAMQQAQIQQHNNDIQAMLQRAALERAQRQKMLR